MSGYIGSPAWKATWRRFVPTGNPRNPQYVYLSSKKAWGKLISPDVVELYGWGPNRYVLERFPPEEQRLLLQSGVHS